MATLAERLAARDAERFVGRERELAFFDGLLVDDPPKNVVLVHGPGGIGKSTLLREVSRRAERRGWRPRVVEGRELAPAPGELERVHDGVEAEQRPLVLFDTYERMTAMGGWLRRSLLPSLPAEAVVVLAGRRPPEADWFQGGWEQLVAELELEPFGEADARRVAAVHGVQDDDAVARLVEWAKGSPLALALGADAARDGDWRPEELEGRPDLVQAILRRMGDVELEGADRDVLAVAAIARAVDARMLRGVLPGIDADEEFAWLRTRSFAEPVGTGVAPHDLVRKALRADLRARRPDVERDLRRRIADHLYARAVRGEARLLPDLADLVDHPAMRWGLGAEGSVRHRIDGLREGDLDEVCAHSRRRAALDGDAFAAWWEPTRRLVEAAPERALVVRDAQERLCGFAYAVTAFGAPPAAVADPILGPWLAHARAEAPGGQALLWRDSLDLMAPREGDIASPILALMNTAVVLRCGLSNPRWSYLPIDPRNEPAVAFARSVNAGHVAHLDHSFGGEDDGIVQCWVLDHGAEGLLGGIRAAVHSEAGLPRDGFRAAIPDDDGGQILHSSTCSNARSDPLTAEDVRDALRNLDQPLELAHSPLASGHTPEERAASVRAALEAAVAGAFGEGPDEQLLRDVLRRGYLDQASSHEAAWWELHLSRATYFRKLRTASARVAEWLIAAGPRV